MKKLMAVALVWLALVLGHSAQAGTVTYVYSDPQGTPLAEADASGNITATFDYRPYGAQALGASGDGPGYTGHVNDPDSGFVYMQARYYDPQTARFVSVDGVAPYGGALFKFNRYLYASANPIAYVDPDGLDDDECSYFCRKMRALSDRFSSIGGDGMASVSGSGAGPGGEMHATLGFVNAAANSNIGEGLSQAAEFTDPVINAAPGGSAAICMVDSCGALGWTLAVIAVMPEGGPVERAVARSAIGMTGEVGEAALRALGGRSQAYFRTTIGGRYVDQLIDGAAHESKVGYASLTADIRAQIAKDVELIETGQVNSVTWHFFDSPLTGKGGPSKPLDASLRGNGINVVRH